ncbi:MAG: hypothetical protein GX437_03935 [Sphingobacteriales bacterium]|nr:hypothetical protein [Sphingobacteriales bacterium]
MTKKIPFLYKLGRLWMKFKFPQYKNPEPIDFESAKTFGIIYSRDNLLTETTIDNLFELLKKNRKIVFSLEYISKNTDDNYKLKEKNHFSLRNSDINMLGLPKKFIRENFCSNQFDILLNLSMEEEIFIHNIAEICQSKIKAGFSTDHDARYDMLIDTSQTKDFKQLVDTVIDFLEKIKKY